MRIVSIGLLIAGAAGGAWGGALRTSPEPAARIELLREVMARHAAARASAASPPASQQTVREELAASTGTARATGAAREGGVAAATRGSRRDSMLYTLSPALERGERALLERSERW
jgi:hypothetical protein